MPAFVFDLARQVDDPGLRRLLRENPMRGSISLSFEREPDYFGASILEGPFHQTLVAREHGGGEIIGVGNRSVRPRYVNGVVQEIGYMSQLRIHPKIGQGLYLARGLADGFRLYRRLHADGRTPFYLMSIVEDNLPARRLLTSGLPGYPCVQDYARLLTFVISPARTRQALPAPRSLRLEHGSDRTAGAILECLNRNNARRQFAPAWTCDSLFAHNLAPSDFFLAVDGDRVMGCIACWDQGAFKQTVVRGYSGALRRGRKLLNLLSPLGQWPFLPEPGTLLRHSYASHLAVDGDDPAVCSALLRALYHYNLERGFGYFMIGLAESHPFCEVVKTYRPLVYASRLYLVTWDEGRTALEDVDMRLIPAPEIAIL